MLSSRLILFSFSNEQCQVTYNLVLEGNQSKTSSSLKLIKNATKCILVLAVIEIISVVKVC